MSKECVICYSEFVGETCYFSCSHSNVCSICVQKWTKSCPECRCEKNRCPLPLRFESPRYVYAQSANDERQRELSVATKNAMESKYGILVETIQYGICTNPRFESQNRNVLRFSVDKTPDDNVHVILRRLFDTEFSVVCSHVNKTITVYY